MVLSTVVMATLPTVSGQLCNSIESDQLNRISRVYCYPMTLCDCIISQNNGDRVDKSSSPYRWLILMLTCCVTIAGNYCYDAPAALKTQIENYMTHSSNGNNSSFETYYSLLYTLYAMPNIILPFFGGIIVDKFGIRRSLLLWCSLCCLGHGVFSFGMSIQSWYVLFLGRFIYGLGGESLVVTTSSLFADWFKDKELAFAFSINLALGRVGSVLNNVLSPLFANEINLLFALWFGLFLTLGGLFCVLILIPIDMAFDKSRQQQQTENLKAPLLIIDDSEGNMVNNSEEVAQEGRISSFFRIAKVLMAEALTLPFVLWMLVLSGMCVYSIISPFGNIASSLLLERDYFMSPPADCSLMYTGSCQSSLNPPNSFCPSSSLYQPPLPYNITLSDGQTFPGQVTFLDVDCTKSVWADECTVEFCHRLTSSEEKANIVMSVPYIVTAVGSPFIGIFIDYYGLRAVIACISCILFTIVHILLGYTSMSAVWPLLGQGIAYTSFAAFLWPAVPLVVDDRLTGIGFGVLTSGLNLVTAAVPPLIATIYEASNEKYIPNTELVFASFSAAGAVMGLYLNYIDYFHLGSILNRGRIAKDDKYRAVEKEEDVVEEVILQSDQQQEQQHQLRSHSRSCYDHTTRGASFTVYEELHRGGAI